VNLDGTLAMVAETSLPVQWLPDGPVGARLKSLRIRLPITGTLEKPKVGHPDPREMNLEGLGEAAQEVLGRLLDSEEERPLSKLLRGLQEGNGSEASSEPRGGILDRILRRRSRSVEPQ